MRGCHCLLQGMSTRPVYVQAAVEGLVLQGGIADAFPGVAGLPRMKVNEPLSLGVK